MSLNINHDTNEITASAGTVTVGGFPIALATTTTSGFLSASDKTKLDGLTGNGTYTLPPASTTVLGGVKIGTGVTADAGGVLSVIYSATAPLVAGVASVGSASTTSRGDHVHPAQTTITGNAGTATALQTSRTIATSGDVTGTATGFDGTANITIPTTLANSGVTAGTYNNSSTAITPYTVDAKGRITGTGAAVTITPAFSSITGKPTTLSGYGITDAQPLDADLTAIAGLSGTSGLLRKTALDTWSLDTNTYLTGNQSITISGDASGTGTTAISLTLANTGVTASTYRSVTVDAKGRVTSGTNPTTLSGYGITDALSNSTTSTQDGYFGNINLFDDSTPSHYLTITNSANLTLARILSINVNDADRTVSLSGNLTVSGTATVSGTNTGDQTITLTGDVTGSGTGSFATTLANSGVTAGTYNNSATSVTPITVDAKGRITSTGAAVTITPAFSSITGKPTTLSGYGITDATPLAIPISNKTAAYTVVSSDAGDIINCTGGTFTVSLTSAATLGAGFNCWVWNTSSVATDAITIDPAGAETVDGVATLILRRGEGFQIISDGVNWQTGDKKSMRGYAENFPAETSVRASATGNRSQSVGHNASSTGDYSFSFGYSASAGSNYSTSGGANSGGNGSVAVTGAGAMVLGGSYASGTDSFSAAVANTTSSYGARATGAVSIGQQTTATANNAVALGYLTVASGLNSTALGFASTASGSYSYAHGSNSLASGLFSYAIGRSARSSTYGKHSFASGPFSTVGDAQSGRMVLRKNTTDATLSVLTSDQTAASASNLVVLGDDSTFIFRGQIVARNTGNDSDSKAWEFKGAIRRGAGAATTALIGSPSVDLIASDGSAWSVSLTADTTNGALSISVTGETGKTIYWVCTVDTTEVTG